MSNKKKNNFYVVWVGLQTGIYSSWAECEKQIKGVKSAKYMGFETLQEAEEAFEKPYTDYYNKKKNTEEAVDCPKELCICVDAACSGNPGKMEYQGVWCEGGDVIFKEGPFYDATNNIGEFIAIVHGLAWLKKNNLPLKVYSDSRTAISWVLQGKVNSKLERTEKNGKVFQLIRRAEKWLEENPKHNEVKKWETNKWGEIPADFGRK